MKYEYKILKLTGDPRIMEKKLNELGEYGWSLVSVSREPAAIHFFLSREVKPGRIRKVADKAA